MEEIIKNRMKSAYDGITLEEELRLKAKEKLLAKVQSGNRRKAFYSVIVAVAVLVLFIVGNVAMIRWNDGRGNEVTPLESNTPHEFESTLELSQVESRTDLEELMNQSNVYYIAFSDNSYLIAQAFGGNGGSEFASSYEGQHEYVKVGHFIVDGEELFVSPIIELTGEGNAMETMGITCFKGTWYLFGKLKDFEQYKLINLTTGTEEIMYCDEGICREILSGETIDYFAKSVGNYWILGSEVVTKEKKDSKTYCDNHEWEEMCTSEMSVRDIYVAQNWIGRSANDYILLELFFDDLVMTDFEDGTAMSANSSENAYQVNNRFSEVNFQVSTELDSDEIIAVTLFGDHCYVTEDVWIGMDREEVTEKMGIEDNLNQESFEKDGYIYTFFEKDGYLYEFRYVTAFVDAGNLPEYASHPWTEKYVLDCACISDALRIKESSVKSFGERIEEGRNILPQ